VVRALGLADYHATWRAMREFTAHRDAHTADELWLCEHAPVYTLGLKVRDKPVAGLSGIPRVATDRGGDITYHGPGQLVAYVLMDLRRRRWGVKDLVWALEQGVIELLADHGLSGARRPGAPGVYVGGRKIAQLGLRIRGACSYHGLALNVDMDLAPFRAIDPCGYAGLEVTQLADLLPRADCAPAAVRAALAARLVRLLDYNGREPAITA
jgi:lipoyl(octanoyl) transferase